MIPVDNSLPAKNKTKQTLGSGRFLMPFHESTFLLSLFPLAGYTIANAASTVTATQLKQAVTMGQDLATYAAYEAYPAFAVAARSDGYGAF